MTLPIEKFNVVLGAVVVQGGHLGSKAWVVKTFNHHDKLFLNLNKYDRDLARSLGCDIGKVYPFEGYNFFEHLQVLRDTITDQMIMAFMFADDPCADAAAAEPAHVVPSTGRAKLFQQAAIPPLLTLTHPPFTIGEGDGARDVAAHDFTVVSSPRRGVNLSIELTPENLDWLADISYVKWTDVPEKTDATDDVALPPLTMDNVKWSRRPGKHYLTCRYRASDGLWKRHTQLVNVVADPELMQGIVTYIENKVQKFYDENHHDPPN